MVHSAAQWYAVKVQSNCEYIVEQSLKLKNITHFLPSYKTLSKRTDRKKTITRPLFPGYLFIKIDFYSKMRLQVLQTPKVVHIISFSNKPSPIDEKIINSLKIVTGSDENVIKPHPLIKKGKEVQVISGPFKGATGLLEKTDLQQNRLIIQIIFLGRAVSVPISLDMITPVL
jgi:transcription antitermination factor NusG